MVAIYAAMVVMHNSLVGVLTQYDLSRTEAIYSFTVSFANRIKVDAVSRHQIHSSNLRKLMGLHETSKGIQSVHN